MCGFCGLLAPSVHWSDTPDVGASGPGPAERQQRVRTANLVLSHYGLRLSVWANRFVLTNRTGRTAIVDSIGTLWPEAERLSGRPCDPLDPKLLDALERRP